MNYKNTYTKHEAALELSIRDETMDHLISTGEIVGRYIGGDFVIAGTELEAFVTKKFGPHISTGPRPVHVQED